MDIYNEEVPYNKCATIEESSQTSAAGVLCNRIIASNYDSYMEVGGFSDTSIYGFYAREVVAVCINALTYLTEENPAENKNGNTCDCQVSGFYDKPYLDYDTETKVFYKESFVGVLSDKPSVNITTYWGNFFEPSLIIGPGSGSKLVSILPCYNSVGCYVAALAYSPDQEVQFPEGALSAPANLGGWGGITAETLQARLETLLSNFVANSDTDRMEYIYGYSSVPSDRNLRIYLKTHTKITTKFVGEYLNQANVEDIYCMYKVFHVNFQFTA